jgi:DNA polymerase
MDDLRKEFTELIADVRAHLEYQRALGVRMIEIPILDRDAPAPRATASAPASSPPRDKAPAKKSALESVREELGDCVRCKLHKGRGNIIFGEGDPEARLVFVGEGPFTGEADGLLTRIIENGMKLDRATIYLCTVVKCPPPAERGPEQDEIEACSPHVVRQIRAIKPAVIVTLGNVPTQTLLRTKEGITKLRGTWQSFEGIPLMPTFHPAHLLRNPADKKLAWEDIQRVMEKLGRS